MIDDEDIWFWSLNYDFTGEIPVIEYVEKYRDSTERKYTYRESLLERLPLPEDIRALMSVRTDV